MATIPDALDWPDILRRERAMSWIPDFGNERGPPGLDGTSQYRNTNGGGLWRLVLNSEQLRRRDHVDAWLTMEVLLQGGKVPIDMPLLLCGRRPTAAVAAVGGWAAQAVSGTVSCVDDILPSMHFSDYSATYGWRMHRIATATAATGDNWNITFWPPARFAVADGHGLQYAGPRCVMRLATSDSFDLELELRKRGNPSAEFIEAF